MLFLLEKSSDFTIFILGHRTCRCFSCMFHNKCSSSSSYKYPSMVSFDVFIYLRLFSFSFSPISYIPGFLLDIVLISSEMLLPQVLYRWRQEHISGLSTSVLLILYYFIGTFCFALLINNKVAYDVCNQGSI